MSKPVLFIIFCGLFGLSACSYPDEWQTFERADFSLTVPPFVDEMDGQLNPEAELEVGSYFRNYYLIVDRTEDVNLADHGRAELMLLMQNDNFTEQEVGFVGTRQTDSTQVEYFYAEVSGLVGNESLNERIQYRMAFYPTSREREVLGLIQWYWASKDSLFRPVSRRVIESFTVR